MLVNGVRCSSVGRVSMDMLAVDITALAAAGSVGTVGTVGIGSEVTLWGNGPNGAILSIDEVAHAAATIGYELMCAVAPRVTMRLSEL